MIKTKIEIRQEEVSVLREIMIASPINVNKRKLIRKIGNIALIIVIICDVLSFLIHEYAILLFGLVLTIFLVWITRGGDVSCQNFTYKKMQNKIDDKLKSGFREYNFDIEGVTVSSEIGYGLSTWNAFKCWGIFKEYIYLKRIDGQMMLVKKSDLSKEDYEALLSLLNTYLIEEKLPQR